MSFIQKEKVIKEKRTIEATKKNMMGPTGKLGVIALNMGSPIIRQGESIEGGFLYDPYEIDESDFECTLSEQNGPKISENKILDSEIDFIQEEGFIFDGLSRGYHIEIKYWHVNHKIEVLYQGYPVYKEFSGELFSYSPGEEWENIVEKLYEHSKLKIKENKEIKNSERKKSLEEQKTGFLNRIKKNWGI